MGALTDQHKRSSTEAGLPHFFSSPKKPRLLLPALTDQRKHSSTESSLPKPHLSPPSSSLAALHLTHPNPFRRPIHAPQRLVRAFCYGSSPTRRLSSQTEMGNFSSNFIRRKHDERFALEEYKKLVEERFASSLGDEAGKVNSVRKKSFSPELSTRNDAEILDGSDVISHKVEDGRNVELELVHVKEERISVKSEPLYKELYDKAKTHDTRLNELNFEVKLLHQKVIQYRIDAEVLRKREDKPKEGLEQLFRPLIAEEEEYISRALHSGSSRKVLVAHESSNIEITREVLQCLRPGAWLNDEVINLYLELLKEREKREPKKFLKCHFFSTFFYKKLISEKRGYDFKAVKRWTTQRKLGYTLIECDKIFVPIHKEIHWCLAVINVKDESFQYLDSLGGLDNYVLKMLARYLKDEVRDKSAKEIDTLSWKKESVDELPLQKNGWDCGMFMLKYADFNSRGLKLCFSQENMPYFRKRTTLEILRLKAE